jgi:hypothetical protein
VEGGAIRIAVDPAGKPWIVRDNGTVFARGDAGWVQIPGLARDIAVDGNGTVYRIGKVPKPGGFNVQMYAPDFGGWADLDGGGVRIGAGERVWLINSEGRVFRFEDGWVTLPGTATDIGANHGHSWIVGTRRASGGFAVARFDGVGWDEVTAGARSITVDPKGDPWIVTAEGDVLRGDVSIRQRLCPRQDVSIPEAASRVNAATLQPGERVKVEPDVAKLIWAGVLLTGKNGPEGWLNYLAPSSFPLPGAPSYGLLANVGNGWRHLGASRATLQNRTGSPRTLRFRVNDNVPGNGSGHFAAEVTFTCRTLL